MITYTEMVKKLMETYMFIKTDDMFYAHLVMRDTLKEVSTITGKYKKSYNVHDWKCNNGKELVPGIDEIYINGKFANDLLYIFKNYLKNELEEKEVIYFLNKYYK